VHCTTGQNVISTCIPRGFIDEEGLDRGDIIQGIWRSESKGIIICRGRQRKLKIAHAVFGRKEWYSKFKVLLVKTTILKIVKSTITRNTTFIKNNNKCTCQFSLNYPLHLHIFKKERTLANQLSDTMYIRTEQTPHIFDISVFYSSVNGVRVVNLTVKSTMFPYRNIHKFTWTSPDGKTHN
jgi:hypothetical protein